MAPLSFIVKPRDVGFFITADVKQVTPLTQHAVEVRPVKHGPVVKVKSAFRRCQERSHAVDPPMSITSLSGPKRWLSSFMPFFDRIPLLEVFHRVHALVG